MSLLNRDAILAAEDKNYEDVPVPEWGGSVRVAGMTGADRNSYQASMVVLGPNGSVQRLNMADQLAKLLSRSLVDEDGNRLFSDKDIKALSAKSGAVLDRLGDVAMRLSGLRKEDVQAEAGKSGKTLSGDSTSD
ncbi:hypothetical protein ACWEQ3_01500 [Streptomyces mirabilis]